MAEVHRQIQIQLEEMVSMWQCCWCCYNGPLVWDQTDGWGRWLGDSIYVLIFQTRDGLLTISSPSQSRGGCERSEGHAELLFLSGFSTVEISFPPIRSAKSDRPIFDAVCAIGP